MKISTDEGPEVATLKLEGRVSGPWVKEFELAWLSLAPSFSLKQVTIDLRGVTQMDSDARRVLSKIYRQTGAKILADKPMTIYFAEEAIRLNRQDSKEA